MNAVAHEREQHYRELMQKASAQIVQLRADLQAVQAAQSEPVAIIGIGCRFPGPVGAPADTPANFWALLRNGVHTVTEVPPQRWSLADYYDPDPTVANKMHVPYGSFLEAIDAFDAGFFGIAPREAVSMDPQQRLLLETAWEALEDAGIAPATLFNSATGVFVGLCGHDYETLLARHAPALQNEIYAVTGNAINVAAGRLAYTLGLTGPCLSIDTACSSSLVAVHQACLSLRNRECNLALVGGCNVIVQPDLSITFSKSNMLAPDGRCKTFDAAADGYVRGEGCGLVVLKRLADAQADGDRIWAVIRGSAVNHDGRSSGLTAPSGPAQQAVIQQAWCNGKVDPDQIAYIEAHGTGTLLGDPIEIGALQAVFGPRQQPLWVGSLKTNIGHTEGAAGIAGLIKVALALYHSEIPPHLHLQTPNPYIDWASSAIQAPTTVLPWPAGQPLAGVSSFGLSGTNAHVVVAAADGDRETGNRRQETSERGQRREDKSERTEGREQKRVVQLLPLSAKSEQALGELAARYQAFLRATPEIDLGDLCYTAQVGRSHFAYRLACVGQSPAALAAQLEVDAARAVANRTYTVDALNGQPGRPQIAFLFTGQGSQYVNMGRDLYESEPVFRAAIDQCDAILQAYWHESLRAVLYPESGEWGLETEVRSQVAQDTKNETDRQSIVSSLHSPPASLIDDTTYTQPALFALEYALATLWQAWGIQPDLLLGHSIGELVAACVAGVFSLEDGLKLVAARGRLMGALPQDGAMVALSLDEAQVQQAIAPYRAELAIAAVNGPERIVIAGSRSAMAQALSQLASVANGQSYNQQAKSQNLNVSHAFHSPLMEPMLAEFYQVAAAITYHQPTLRIISNVTGQLAGAEIATPAYWVRHVRDTVRFADGIQTLHAQGCTIYLEVGPKPILINLASEIVEKMTSDKAATAHPLTLSPAHPVMLPSLHPTRNAVQQMVESLGALYTQGVTIDWQGFHQGTSYRKVTAPTYPFQRQR